MKTFNYIYTPHRYRSEGYTRNTIRLTAYNLEGRIDELGRRLSAEKPDVFVSHKSDDKEQAEKVAIKIAECGLTAYLDIWDPNVDGDGPELVDYIDTVIGCCNGLIAVLSRNTVSSWWVPLEIGIAITKKLHLGSFLVPTRPYTILTSHDVKRHFPSYLWKWPVLRNMTDLEDWCKERQITTTTQNFYESLEGKHPHMFRQ